jgi:exonuclease VII small subunit
VIQTANNQMSSYERVMQELVRLIQSVEPGQVVRVNDAQR